MTQPLILLLSACLSTGLFAQMDVTDAATAPFTPENLISNIFLGDGVSIIDITYEGDPLAVGYFKDGTNAIGLDRGILLTSGRAASQNCGGGPYGADCTGNVFSSNQMNGNASDVDLNSIANGTPEDVAKYTITFQPFADTLRFRYVFASEEYPEYSCSPFNDVFGFFISGPGITGTFSNGGQNIALIPGTNTPVSINNIHPQDGTNCPAVNDQYYNSNNGIALQPVYDGYLDVFTAEAVVIPCETYTIKLVIADVSDNFYDSGVFLEAKSFGTGTIDVDAVTLSLDGVIAEGCVNGAFSFSLPTEAEQDLPLDYTIIGTAENGVDYGFIPSDLFIPQGSSSITVDIYAIHDGLPGASKVLGSISSGTFAIEIPFGFISAIMKLYRQNWGKHYYLPRRLNCVGWQFAHDPPGILHLPTIPIILLMKVALFIA
ncbi:MAG: choice-of-anchor L domain-containing protein [Saprospiraceae bacterium]